MSVLRRLADSARLRGADLADRVTGRADRLVPPRRLWFVGPGDFRPTGDEFLGHFVELAGLRPDERVLDVGCGIGRMARPLTGYLDAGGSYEGFDVATEGVEWCARRYARDHPAFRFRTVDVRNPVYNPGGTGAAGELRFPYPGASFDFAILTSVFTHMLPDEVERYLAELGRVLRPGGRFVATFFLGTPEAREHQAAGAAQFVFDEARGPASVVSGQPAELAVSHDERWVRARLAAHGFTVREPIAHGTWSGRPDGRSLQDLVVADLG